MTELLEERLFAVPEMEDRAYDGAVAAVTQAKAQVSERLADLRHARDAINAEVRTLVEEERRLERMLRVGKELTNGKAQEEAAT